MNKYWETKKLAEMTQQEWEDLCDGCGLCCLIKFVDEDTDELCHSRLACKLINLNTCKCSDYVNRKELVPDCIKLTPSTVNKYTWLPDSCAYKRLAAGKKLSKWHPLVSKSSQSVHELAVSIKGWVTHESKEKMSNPDKYLLSDLSLLNKD